jgi:hypothetical protein
MANVGDNATASSSGEPDETDSSVNAASSGPGDSSHDNGGSAPAAAPAAPVGEKKWYIVHTYSGHENKAKLTLLERVRNASLTEYFGDVLVPTESVMELVKGQRRTTTRAQHGAWIRVQTRRSNH